MIKWDRIKKEPATVEEILGSLKSAKAHLIHLLNQGKQYDALIGAILRANAEGRLSIKDLQGLTGMGPEKLRKQARELYEDFLAVISNDPGIVQVSTVSHTFCVEGMRGFVSFKCVLPATPRVGEGVNLPFLYAALGTAFFHVYKIENRYSHTNVEIVVWVRWGEYNKHVELMKDRAILNGELDSSEEFEKFPFEIERKIRELYN